MSKDDIIRAEILEAAKRIFRKWGLKKATMEEIAEEAGKAKSTLYYYYKSKEEIFDEAVIGQLALILENAKTAIAGIDSIKEKLKSYVVVSLTEMKTHASYYSIVWEELKANRRLLQKLRDQLEAEERRFFKEILQLGVESGEFHFDDEQQLTAAAHTLAGMVRALVLYLFLEAEESEQIDIAAKLITNGL
jgi:AcrR family transcriptional regulator